MFKQQIVYILKEMLNNYNNADFLLGNFIRQQV